MEAIFQLTNKHNAPKGYPFKRVWLKNKQLTLIGDLSIRFIVQAANSQAAFDLNTVITDMETGKRTDTLVSPETNLKLKGLDFMVVFRAAKWEPKEFLPTHFLVEFISLNSKVTLAICK